MSNVVKYTLIAGVIGGVVLIGAAILKRKKVAAASESKVQGAAFSAANSAGKNPLQENKTATQINQASTILTASINAINAARIAAKQGSK